MNTAPIFDESFLPPIMSLLNSDYWGTVMKTYEGKNYLETVYATLDYIQEGLSQKALNPEKTKYSLPHGSIVVNLEIKENHLYVNAPFLRVPAKYLIPLMRQVSELNFGTLVLAQIKLEGNDIYFRCDMPLELCEPFKLYRVIEEICIQADANDDVFIEKFGAERFSEMQVEPFTPKQIDIAFQKFQEYLREAIQYHDYFIGRRLDSFGWDAYFMAFTKIDYFMRPQGYLKAEIEKSIRELNANVLFNEKVLKGRKNVEKFLEIDKEKFAESMYNSKQFISEKTTYNLSNVHNYLRKTAENSKDEVEKKDYMGATLTILTGFYGLIYYYVIPQNICEIIIQGIKEANALEWEAAAHSLRKACEKVMSEV
jgi:hypothetical protein